MDPISLTLGIIPLLGGSLKMYKSTYAKLKLFRHYSREVDRVRRQFTRQKQFFSNEICLLLKFTLHDDSLVSDMVRNDGHHSWHSVSVEMRMKRYFGADNCSVLKDIVQEVGQIITESEKELECFDCLKKQQRKVNKCAAVGC
jgi:hypothetical protein